MAEVRRVLRQRSRARRAATRDAALRTQDVAETWRVAAALVATPALADQLNLLLEAAPRLGGADTATIYLHDEATGLLRVLARFGYPPGTFGQPRQGGLTEHVLATGEPVVVDDTAADPRVNPRVREAGIRSLVALPLVARRAVPSAPGAPGVTTDDRPFGRIPSAPLPSAAPFDRLRGGLRAGRAGRAGAATTEAGRADRAGEPEAGEAPGGARTIGVLYVSARRPHAFDAEAVETLKGLAALASVAIENGRLLEGQRAAAAHLADALRLRDQFVSVASHELKAPLTPLKGYAQAIRRRLERAAAGGRPIDAAWLRRVLAIMVDQVDRLDRLVTDLLDVSRLSAGRFALAPEPVDLVAVAQEIFARFHDSLDLLAAEVNAPPERRHTLRLRLGAAALPGQWDRNRLDQLLTNLLSNAVKYSPEGGVVELRVAPVAADPDPGALARYRQRAPDVDPTWVHLAVRDEGIGLPPDEAAQAALFEAFTRGEAAPGARVTGFGLGLYICAEIVRRHGGAIWGESAGPGRGATFHVLLPRGE